MSALYQYWLYSRCEKRGASDAWVRGGKERALLQIRATLRAAADLFGCSTRTIRRQFAHCLITVPGGVRIHRSDVIAAIM